MKNLLTTTSLLCLLASPALAQSATGVGVGQSESNSAAGAIAVNRGNGNSSSRSSLTVNNPANTTSTATVNQNVSGSTTSNINTNTRTELTGTSTVKNVPTAVAPSLAAAGIETCLGSVSGGGSIVGFGGSFGTTVPDPGCQARLDARTLWSMGLKSAAVARLCIREDIYNSMPDVCEQYRPRQPYVAPAVGYERPVAVAPGTIMVVEGKTGKERSCDVYDQVKFRCNKWTGEATKVARVKPRKPVVVAATKPTATAPVVVVSEPPAPAP